jgi:hypothetical protein
MPSRKVTFWFSFALNLPLHARKTDWRTILLTSNGQAEH